MCIWLNNYSLYWQIIILYCNVKPSILLRYSILSYFLHSKLCILPFSLFSKEGTFNVNRCSIIFIWFVTFCHIKEHDNVLVRSSKYNVSLASWYETSSCPYLQIITEIQTYLICPEFCMLYGLVVVRIRHQLPCVNLIL